MDVALECIDLSKSFKNKEVVKSVDLKLEKGKIYGVLGRNGAGKTTLLKIICNHYFPTHGKVKIFDKDISINQEILRNVCFVMDKGIFLETFTVKQILNYSAMFYKNWDNDFADRLVNIFNINKNFKYSKLSLGMKSIVNVIVGLSSRAEITIYDEPYLGLDAPSRQKFYNILLEDYMENPRTIIISTHLIDEMEKLFEEILIIDKGELILKEDVEKLREQLFFIIGKKENVQGYLENKKVLYEEVIGNIKTVAIFGNITEEERKKIKNAGLEITNLPIQKFFIYITEQKNGGLIHE